MRNLAIIAVLGLLAATPEGAVAQDASGDAVGDPAGNAVGDPGAGRKVFNRCRACHNLNAGRAAKAGPDLDGLIGRTAGTSAGYGRYSKALRESGIVWTGANIDVWITDPDNFLPGNKMALAPVRNARDRADLIAYLIEATATK